MEGPSDEPQESQRLQCWKCFASPMASKGPFGSFVTVVCCFSILSSRPIFISWHSPHSSTEGRAAPTIKQDFSRQHRRTTDYSISFFRPIQKLLHDNRQIGLSFYGWRSKYNTTRGSDAAELIYCPCVHTASMMRCHYPLRRLKNFFFQSMTILPKASRYLLSWRIWTLPRSFCLFSCSCKLLVEEKMPLMYAAGVYRLAFKYGVDSSLRLHSVWCRYLAALYSVLRPVSI